jgi:oxygen-dependent protoporphyrinogen oxidase
MDSDLTSVNGATASSGAAHRVVVVGGGISGLAAAHRISTSDPNVRLTLVEAESRLGGKIATEHVDGFVIEGGPDSFLATKPRGVGLSGEVGLEDRLQGVTVRAKRAFILYRNHLHDLPEGLSGLVPTRLAPLAQSSLLSPRGKARIALDYVLPARTDDDESVGGFMRRRLGHEAWERLVEPLMAGIYAADGDQLSLAASFPQLRAAERAHGGLIRGVLAARRSASSPAAGTRSPFLTPAGGLGELVSTLEKRLRAGGVVLRLGSAVKSVSAVNGGYEVRLANADVLSADAVIVATPSFMAARLLDGVEATLARELAAIPHVSTTIVSLAFRSDQIPHPLDGHGYVIPRVAGGSILACTWSSRKWAGRAPAGWELLRLFIGRAGDGNEEVQSADDAKLIALARQEIAARLGINAQPSLTRVQRWPRGMPQYIMGHPERVSRIEAALRGYPGLVLAGSGYSGVGIPDCIASGERAATAVLAHIHNQPANDIRGNLTIAEDKRFHRFGDTSLTHA